VPSGAPTPEPTEAPTGSPTNSPTAPPTVEESDIPSSAPVTGAPTEAPTVAESDVPSGSPTPAPTGVPTVSPTTSPTATPTIADSDIPSSAPVTPPPSPSPTVAESDVPSGAPTPEPTEVPTGSPTNSPTTSPVTPLPTPFGENSPPELAPTSMPTPAPIDQISPQQGCCTNNFKDCVSWCDHHTGGGLTEESCDSCRESAGQDVWFMAGGDRTGCLPRSNGNCQDQDCCDGLTCVSEGNDYSRCQLIESPGPIDNTPIVGNGPPESQQVTELWLMDASTNLPISQITEGSVFYLGDLGTTELNVMAVTVPDPVGSVTFELNGALVRTENVSPYALGGDNPPGEYFADTSNLKAGLKYLVATPYSDRVAGGSVGGSLGVNFEIMNGSEFPDTPAPVAASTPAPITPATPAPAPANSVYKFVLIDSDQDTEIMEIEDGATLYLGDLPEDLNVQAVTNPEKVGSVKFEYDNGAHVKTENVAPYAMFGDSKGNYRSHNGNHLTPGTHTLKATPYSRRKARGTAWTSMTVQFTVVDGSEFGAAPITQDSEDTDSSNSSKFCCAPKDNLQHDCSGETGWCHESESRCGMCDGAWVNALNPPVCTNLWKKCSSSDECCPGSSCQGNFWHKSCKPGDVASED